jgi:peptidoglycan hydrolase-like protein with peptidoglycan-binding domain
METLSYLHLALAYESATDATDVYTVDSLKVFEWFKRQKLVMHARIYLLSLVVILGILGMAGEAFAQRPLRLGDRDPQVTFIQNRLRQLRYLNRSADGVFDRATREAVIRFQRTQGLNPDGIVGTQTESALFAEFGQTRQISSQEFSFSSSPNRVLQQGDRSVDVTTIQQRLRELGYFKGQLTGYFGPSTQAAVIRFQLDNNIDANGIVDSRTRTALLGSANPQSNGDDLLGMLPPPPLSNNFPTQKFNPFTPTAVLRFGDRGSEVQDLQQELRQRGFNPGRVDGSYGSQTQEAVRQFQRVNGLFPDGIAGRETLTALGISAEVNRNRYVIVIPLVDENTLYQVRAIEGFASASVADSKLGQYVNAGSFPNRASAESRSYQLRSQGLDARVAYFP